MYYSELVKKACVIMYDAHKEDKDKGGYPYVFHPFYLATQMDDEESTCAALLHDVVEDHGARYSFAYLEQAGFPESVTHALRLLTHTGRCALYGLCQGTGKRPDCQKSQAGRPQAQSGCQKTERSATEKI